MTGRYAFSKHPKTLWILALTELCERFAFWGIGNLLVLYTIEYYQFSDAKATQIYGIFAGFAAFSPLLGGWIADRWNYQSPILLGAILNAAGCFMIGSGISILFYPSLFLIALGYGIFTPSILTVLGFTYHKYPHLREAGFSIYYASINIGVFLALASLSTIVELTSWNLAFTIAGIVQLLGLVPLIWYLIHHKETYRALKSFHANIKSQQKPLTRIEKDRMKVIFIFCAISIIFWLTYNQAYSSMEIFTHKFMNKAVGTWNIPEGVFLSSESFFLILLAPVLSYLYGWLQNKNKDPSPSSKTALSLVFIAICFLIMTLASLQIPKGATSAMVPYQYVIISFFFMAIGEMLLAPIGLSMITNLVPQRYSALTVGMWYVCVGLAYFMGGMIASLMGRIGTLSDFFSIFVIITMIPAVILLFFIKKLTKLSHID